MDIEEVGDQIVTALCCIVDTIELLPFDVLLSLKSYCPLIRFYVLTAAVCGCSPEVGSGVLQRATVGLGTTRGAGAY